MFADMQKDYHQLKVEYEEAMQATAKYREDLYTCKNELKGASEAVKGCRDSLLAIEKEKEYADLERDWAKADLEKAKATLQEQDRAFHVATQEQDMLKG